MGREAKAKKCRKCEKCGEEFEQVSAIEIKKHAEKCK